MSFAREHLRPHYPRQATSVLVWLVATIVAAFVLQLVLLSPWFGSGTARVNPLALTIPGLSDGYGWTLVTHSFLHDTHSLHLLFTLLGLIFVGRELEPVLGSRRFLGVYAGAIILGGLAWTAVHWRYGGGHLGAGAGVYGLLVVLAGVYSEMKMKVFLIPLTVRLKHIVFTLLGLDLGGLLLYELRGADVPLGLTPSAHLGGMLAGWLYIRYLHARNGWDRDTSFSLPAGLGSPIRKDPIPPTIDLPRRRPVADLRANVDQILDKINSHGFGSLSVEERRTLDEARDMLSKP